MSSRPITPVSPIQSARPDASIHSARPMSAKPPSRPVYYVGTQQIQPADAVSHSDHSQTTVQDPSAVAQAADLHDEVVIQTQESPELPRSNSHMSGSQTLLPSRAGTLKKKASLHKRCKSEKDRQQEKQLCWLSAKHAVGREGKVRRDARKQQHLLLSSPYHGKSYRAPCNPLPRCACRVLLLYHNSTDF